MLKSTKIGAVVLGSFLIMSQFNTKEAVAPETENKRTLSAHSVRGAYIPFREDQIESTTATNTKNINPTAKATNTTKTANTTQIRTTSTTTTKRILTMQTTTSENITTTTETEPILLEPISDIPEYYEYYDNWFWVGDSRTVGLAQALPFDIEYMAEVGMGLDWFFENQFTVFELRGYNVVFNLGVNDMGNIYNYIDLYNNMPQEFIDNNNIFIVSVNPIDDYLASSNGYQVSNQQVYDFNIALADNLRSDFYFIDTYTYLSNYGFDTLDGLHYDNNTYLDIYNYVISTITGS